jgi:hypothetical protein
MNSCVVFNMFSKHVYLAHIYIYTYIYIHIYILQFISEFINLFEIDIFLSWFTKIFNLIYFALQIVNKN